METGENEGFFSRLAAALAVGVVALAALLASSEATPLTWDEGDAFNRAACVAGWTGAVVDAAAEKFSINNNDKIAENAAAKPGLRELFSDAALAAGWPCAIYREGHPGGYPAAIAAGKGVATRILPFLSEKTKMRFGSIALFALALTAVFWRTSALFGRVFGVAAVVGIATIPRVFGHAQLAGGDSLLISSWLIAWSVFDPFWRKKRSAICWGIAVGVSFCAKFSGFAVAVPFLFVNICAAISVLVAKNRAEARRIGGRTALGFAVAAAVFFAMNPPLWSRPFSGFETFVALNVRRDGFEIPILFLGKLYSPSRPLPFWNGFFWLGTTIPTPLLAFAAVGVAATIFAGARRFGTIFDAIFRKNGENRDVSLSETETVAKFAQSARFWAATTALALGLTLPIVRAFPGTPPHDGARMLIASFPFWGILAAIGAKIAFERFAGSGKTARTVAASAILAAFGVGVGDLLFSAPQYLSFYNAAIGGVAGATRRGMEPTYYWDAFDAETVAVLNAKIDAARDAGRPSGVLFGAFSTQTLDYYRRWGTLKTNEVATISASDAFLLREKYGFYVLQRRPSGLTALDLTLMKTARPLARKFVANPYCRDKKVVALEIYDFRDVERVLATLQNGAVEKGITPGKDAKNASKTR